MKTSVLVVEEDTQLARLLTETLGSWGLQPQAMQRPDVALTEAVNGRVDLIITDIELGASNGLELCARVNENAPDVPVIVMTGSSSLENAIAAIRAGAYDFITKPIQNDSLRFSVDRALKHLRLNDEVKRLREQVAIDDSDPLLGESPAMESMREMLARVADTDVTVLITGESGTGKELAARAIHEGSARHQNRFVAVNCAAMPENLLESELFGHVRGAFTDAKEDRDGLFVRASGGTLLLDEIGEMPVEMQAKLLRVLEERRVRPVGASSERDFDTRLVCATNRDLRQMVDAGEFRDDLYYRIKVLEMGLPPLRDRGNDVFLLGQRFLEKFARTFGRDVTGFSPEAAKLLRAYPWPGNVRELQNAVERAVALARFELVTPEDLPTEVAEHQSTQWNVDPATHGALPTLKEVEERYIRKVLDAVDGNKTRAAEVLGLDRRTLYRKLERFDAAA